MNILLFVFFVTGLLFAFVLAVGEFLVYKESVEIKTRCSYSVYLAAVLIIYLLATAILCAIGFAIGATYAPFYAIFGVSPFIIGKFSNYEHIRRYAVIQILIVLMGCAISYYNFTLP